MSDYRSPNNLDAERAVLGGCLVAPERLDEARAVLSAPDFFRRGHQVVWSALCDLADRDQPLDVLLVFDALRRAGAMSEAGGEAYITGLTDGVPRSTNVVHYAQLVREASALRASQAVAAALLREASEEEEPSAVLRARAVEALESIATARQSSAWVDSPTLTHEAVDLAERLNQARGAVTGVRVGFPDLDDTTRGLQPGQLVLLAARPSVGKSAFALVAAMHVAKTHAVAFFQLEMSRSEMALRMLAIASQVNLHSMSSGHLRDAEYARVAYGMEQMHHLHLLVDDTPLQTVASIRAAARVLHRRQPLGLVVIDYLQLIEADGGRQDSRATIVGTISRGLKRLAKELDCPVLALSQLSRQVEGRADKTPQLSDLRESGSLEQDADMVWFLHRPDTVSEESVQDCWLIIGKQRQGPTGRVPLRYIREQTRFVSTTASDEPERRFA